MTKTTAPKKTPSPTDGGQEPAVDPAQVALARTQFLSAILDLTWKLALVVLVPLLLGSYLDSVLDLYPVLTLVGFAIAIIGMVLVVWRQVKELDPNKKSIGGTKK